MPVRLRSFSRNCAVSCSWSYPFVAGCGAEANAAKRTVCTVTVNSPDEKKVFRQWLPEDDYRFVELVERGRPDWLASACRQGVRCDLLVISGRFDERDGVLLGSAGRA